MRLKLNPQCCDPCCGVVWPIECLTLQQFITEHGILVEDYTGFGFRYMELGVYTYKCGYVDGTTCNLVFVSPNCLSMIVIDFQSNLTDEVTGDLNVVLQDPCSGLPSFNPSLQFVHLTEEFFCEGIAVTNEPIPLLSEFSPIWTFTLVDHPGGGIRDCIQNPPPEPTDCTGLDDCDPMPDATFDMFGWEDYDEPFTVGFLGLDGTYHWHLSNLNLQFFMPSVGVLPGSYSFEFELYTPGTYTTAVADGIFVRDADFDASGFDPVLYEHYAYKLELQIKCTGDGTVEIEWINIHYEEFISYNGGPPTPTTNGTFMAQFSTPTFLTTVIEGQAYVCGSGVTVAEIEYSTDAFNPTAGSDHSFNAAAMIGGF